MTQQEKYEKQKEINKELVDENEALKFAARMSKKTEKQLRKEIKELSYINGRLLDQVGAATKRVIELEEENNKLLDVINNQDVKIADLEKKNANLNATLDLRRLQLDDSAEIIKEMQSNVDTLQKANAELKADYKVLSCSVGDFDELQEKLEGEQRKNNGLSDQLTKAKDLLLRFIELKNKPCAVGHSVNMLLYENICADVQKFLKEIEK